LDHIGVSNDDLGRQGIDEADADIHKRAKRFSFRRNVIPASKTAPTTAEFSSSIDVSLDGPSDDNNNNNNVQMARQDTTLLGSNEKYREDATVHVVVTKEHRELAAAFRMMAATRSPDKEGDNFGAAAIREDSYVVAISSAKAIESRVVELIRTIGEIVVQSDDSSSSRSSNSPQKIQHNNNSNVASPLPQVRSDPIFEYFCEKNMLSLLVDITKEKKQGSADEGRRWGTDSCYHGVVWSPQVKAQVFATVSMLVSECRNRSVLYYLLSHNCVNELITCMLPLQQWTDQALSKMMPPYADMLQKLAVQLADDPDLFPFLTMENSSDDDYDEKTKCPLYSAALETATGSFAQSDSIVYGTCLVVAVNIMQITNAPIQNWVCNAGAEQRRLADHLCQRLLDRYYRIVNLTTGPVVDGVRSNSIAGQLASLKDHMAMIHEVIWSGVRGLDVRLCESLLQRVVSVLLKNLVPHRRRAFLSGVGLVDADVIPEQEALAQVSCIFLALLFSTLSYIPFQRMLAVALLHEKSTPLWGLSSTKWTKEGTEPSESYVFMPILSDIVTGEEEIDTCPNMFRAELIKGLSGQYGEWRTAAWACLLQTALESEAMDDESLRLLKITPSPETDAYSPTALEEAISAFLVRPHKPSAVTMQTLEYVGYLAIQVIHKTIVHFTKNAADLEQRIKFVLEHSPVWKALLHVKTFFAEGAQKCQSVTGVSDIFLDLVESSIASRYTARYNETGNASYRCPLSQRGCASTGMNSEILVRKLRGVSPNDVETSRFFIHMTLHFQALCKCIDRLCFEVRNQGRRDKAVGLDLVDKADELTRIIGGLADKPKSGAEIDLTGRMAFRFESALKGKEAPRRTDSPSRIRVLPEDMAIFRAKTSLMLVLDPTDMFIVRPMKSTVEENRATVLCSVSLRSVIAAADDGEWLHVAVRHEDVGFLIKNGNMALRLENNGSCLIVKQYLDRSREMLRQELLGKMSMLLAGAAAPKDAESAHIGEEKKSPQ
jgi:hypothetical protein